MEHRESDHPGRYPVLAILLVLLACVRFEYRTANWAIHLLGLAGGLLVLAIIAAVLLFRIFDLLQDICLSRGLLPSRIRSRYDVLIPVAFFAVLPKGSWGDWPEHRDQNLDSRGFHWEFHWSEGWLDVGFVAAITGVVLLIRVLYLLRAITQHSQTGGHAAIDESPLWPNDERLRQQ